MKDGRSGITQAFCAAMANAYLYCIQKGIHFPSDDYTGTPAVLFIWLKAQMICIDSLFIHCWTRHCIYERGQNGPNYSRQCLPVTPQQSKMMKASNWEEKSNQRPLVVFCKFRTGMGNISCCDWQWFTWDIHIRRETATHTHIHTHTPFLSLTLHVMATNTGPFIKFYL